MDHYGNNKMEKEMRYLIGLITLILIHILMIKNLEYSVGLHGSVNKALLDELLNRQEQMDTIERKVDHIKKRTEQLFAD